MSIEGKLYSKARHFALYLIVTGMFFSCTPRYVPKPDIAVDEKLQKKLTKIVDDLNLNEAIRNKQIALGVVDLYDINRPEIAGFNAKHMIYAASLPKIAILFALFKRIEEGKIDWTEEVKAKAEAMTRYSSNVAATELFYMVEPEYIKALMTSPKYNFYDEGTNGGLWVGKEYDKEKALFPDPQKGLSHAANVVAVLRFYYLLESGKLLSPHWNQVMRNVLTNSAYCTKFMLGLRNCCPKAVMLRKAGSWGSFNSDSAVVFNEGKRYIIVGLANSPDSEKWLEDLAFRIDGIIKVNKNVKYGSLPVKR